MSHEPHNIVIRGMGVRVKHTDEEIERSMVVNHIFVNVLRTFGKYCRLIIESCCGSYILARTLPLANKCKGCFKNFLRESGRKE